MHKLENKGREQLFFQYVPTSKFNGNLVKMTLLILLAPIVISVKFLLESSIVRHWKGYYSSQ